MKKKPLFKKTKKNFLKMWSIFCGKKNIFQNFKKNLGTKKNFKKKPNLENELKKCSSVPKKFR